MINLCGNKVQCRNTAHLCDGIYNAHKYGLQYCAMQQDLTKFNPSFMTDIGGRGSNSRPSNQLRFGMHLFRVIISGKR